MTRAVWKYELIPGQPVYMPRGAKIISVAQQNDSLRLWAIVDKTAPLEPRAFFVFGTGHALPDEDLVYLGTVHLYSGTLVFHVFEATP